MYLVAIAWIYVVVMMAVAEAASPNGSLLGAFFTLLLYGLLPLSIVLYILSTPGRKRRLREQFERERAQEQPAATASEALLTPDASGQPTAAAEPERIAPVREKP
ncbi:MAG: hypothetical protein RR718_15805 [Comamonas sp.]